MRTEISVKFVRESVSHMLNEPDLALLDWRTDEQGLFGLALSGLKRRPPGPTTDVLVNEFRDTNRRQLELLKRLVPSRDRKFPFRLALRGNRRKHGTAHGRVMRDLNLTYESHSGASENLLLSSDRVTRHNNLERLSDDEAGVPLLHVPK